jgi:hypothetical protein
MVDSGTSVVVLQDNDSFGEDVLNYTVPVLLNVYVAE